MKQIILLSIFIAITARSVFAQSSNTADSHRADVNTSSSFTTDSVIRHTPKTCMAWKIGLVSMGAGAVSVAVGARMIYDYTHNGGQSSGPGALPVLLGIVAFGTGVGLTIGGGIHDIVVHHRQRLSIVAPTAQQLGIAWHF